MATEEFYKAEPILDRLSNWKGLEDRLRPENTHVVRFARGLSVELGRLSEKRIRNQGELHPWDFVNMARRLVDDLKANKASAYHVVLQKQLSVEEKEALFERVPEIARATCPKEFADEVASQFGNWKKQRKGK